MVPALPGANTAWCQHCLVPALLDASTALRKHCLEPTLLLCHAEATSTRTIVCFQHFFDSRASVMPTLLWVQIEGKVAGNRCCEGEAAAARQVALAPPPPPPPSALQLAQQQPKEGKRIVAHMLCVVGRTWTDFHVHIYLHTFATHRQSRQRQ